MTTANPLCLRRHFATLKDPRRRHRRLRHLLHIITIAICAVIAGAAGRKRGGDSQRRGI